MGGRPHIPSWPALPRSLSDSQFLQELERPGGSLRIEPMLITYKASGLIHSASPKISESEQ